MEEIFGIENFNLISDNENYYFFRALNMPDNEDLENGTILDKNGNIIRIRTDRERYLEDPAKGLPKYNENSKISLEEVFDHIKIHYRKDTNCISLSSSSNVAITYGKSYKNKYVMIKVPKKEFGKKVISAGQYILEEISKKIDGYIVNASEKIKNTFLEIDDATSVEELNKKIEKRYTSKNKIDVKKVRIRKGVIYRAPYARFSNYQFLNSKQQLEKNRIIAKLTVLERFGNQEPLITNTKNNNLLIQTLERAYSSLELIHYGEIEKEEIISVSEEMMYEFSLLQQAENENNELKLGELDGN